MKKFKKVLAGYTQGVKETKRVISWSIKEFVTPEAWIWARKMMVVFVVLMVMNIAQPFAVRYVFDGLIQQKHNWVLSGFIVFVICMLAQKFCGYTKDVYREWFLGINAANIDKRVTELFFGKSLGQLIQHGSKLNNTTMDRGRGSVLNIQTSLLFFAVPAILYFVMALISLTVISPICGLVFIGLVGVYVFSGLHLNFRLNTECDPIEEKFRRLQRHRFERWEDMERVTAAGKKQEEIDYMERRFDEILTEDRRFWISFIGHCTKRDLINIVVLAGVIAYGAYQVVIGNWTIGLLYPLYNFSVRLSERMWEVGEIYLSLSKEIPRVRSMMNVLMIEPDVVEVSDAAVLEFKAAPKVEFIKVSHRYPDDNNNYSQVEVHTLQDISFEVNSGEKLAVIGPSGAGKTTIAKLLLRYMDPQQGSILVNGIDLRQVKLESWMSQIGVILQDVQVFDNTLRYNLIYGLTEQKRQSMSDEDIWSLMKLLRIDFSDRLTEGLETKVGKSGMKLSGGQAQRLMIGAAAIKRPCFMVIDEATSNLDSTTEKAVQEGLAQVLSEAVGALVIAHRLSTVRHLCNKFMVLKPASGLALGQSQIEAVAHSFEELYDLSPTFRQLASDQGLVIKPFKVVHCSTIT